MSRSDPEHTFAEDVLKSGENTKTYTAGEALSAREGVALNDDYEVVEASNGEEGIGVNAYDVAAGQEATVIVGDGSVEVRVEASDAGDLAAPSAGDAVSYDGAGGFKFADANADDVVWGVANSDGTDGQLFDVLLAIDTLGNIGDST